MKYYRLLITSFCCLFITGYFAAGCSTEISEEDSANPQWDQVVEYAKEHIPSQGLLMVKTDGFGYLKVDDDYIHTLLPMLGLQEEGFREPPYFRRTEAPGAHISIFYENEHVAPTEIGEIFPFELKQIVIVQPSRNARYVVLQVASPELEKLREKYGLKSKLHGHEFHITLGKKTIRNYPKR